jgi:hypothetical protein
MDLSLSSLIFFFLGYVESDEAVCYDLNLGYFPEVYAWCPGQHCLELGPLRGELINELIH